MSDVEQDFSRDGNIELSIIMPCLNEAETLGTCIAKAQSFLHAFKIQGEIIIADNGSTDGSQEIAKKMGAKVLDVRERGYGNALKGGIMASRGKYIIMGDADDSYDFTALEDFVVKLRNGYDLVMGNRFKGGIKAGAMPPLHKYLGNPVLSGIGRLFFKTSAKDFHCGLRGFNKASIDRLELKTTGMEFASEMVVKASLHRLKIMEVPTTLSPDGRNRPPHLRSWHDGWRHLRFLLLFSPRWLFLYPGLVLAVSGLLVMLTLISGAKTINGITFDINTMLYSSMSIILGFQSIAFALFSKVYAIRIKMFPKDDRITRFIEIITLERGIVVGLILFIMGMIGSVYSLITWGSMSFGALVPNIMMRITIPSVTLVVVGIQVVSASFFLGILGGDE